MMAFLNNKKAVLQKRHCAEAEHQPAHHGRRRGSSASPQDAGLRGTPDGEIRTGVQGDASPETRVARVGRKAAYGGAMERRHRGLARGEVADLCRWRTARGTDGVDRNGGSRRRLLRKVA